MTPATSYQRLRLGSRPPNPLWLANGPSRPEKSRARNPVACSSESHSSGSSAAEVSRRCLLQSLTIGGAYAWAGRKASAADPSDATSLEAQLEQRVHEFALSNGLRFVVSERRAAPIVSCHIYADVGAFQEEDGLTGIAHLLEHMAFKGTPRIGTKDYHKEAPLLDAMDEVFYTLRDAGSPREAARLQARLTSLQSQAAALSVPNAYGALLQRQGGVGLNAATSHDATKYFVSLPANKLELWFALEGERFQAPVFRELYSEKAVVSEERRLRVDNAPLGPFQEAFSLASLTNNYRRPVIGYQQDIDRIGRLEVRAFFQKHYRPTNLVVAIAGDVRPEQVRQLAEKYFGGWQPLPPPLPPPPPATPAAAAALPTSAPAAAGAVWDGEVLPRPPAATGGGQLLLRRKARAGPAVMQAYYRPSVRGNDSLALEMVSDVLSGSRSARLYKALVLEGRALSASAVSSYPAEKYSGQFLVYGIATKGVLLERLDADISAELAALAGEGPTPAELRRYKKAARTSLLQALVSNSSLAAALASYSVLGAGWREVLGDLQRIEGMGSEQVRGAAERLFAADNCYRGYVLPEK